MSKSIVIEFFNSLELTSTSEKSSMVTLENCRLCQDRYGNVKLDQNLSLVNLIYICTGVKIPQVEDLTLWPRSICDQCHAVIELVQQFRLYTRMIDQNLQHAIQNKVLSKNNEKTIKENFKRPEEVVKEVIFLQFDGEEATANDDVPIEFLQTDGNDDLEDVTNEFQCPVCHIMYFKAEGLEAHKRSHTELCCFSCQKVFDDVESRENHKCNELEVGENKRHTNLKPNVKVVPLIIKEDVLVQCDDGSKSEKFDLSENTNRIYVSTVAVNVDNLDKKLRLIKNINNESSSVMENPMITSNTDVNDIVDKNKLNFKKGFVRTCPTCNEKFPNKQDLNMHLKTHVGSFVCQYEGCRKICKSDYALKYHLWKHKTERNNLLCKICGKSFQFASYLRHHEKMHTGTKDFKCQYCDKAFYRKAELDPHVRAHHEGIRHYCSMCPKSFLTAINLQRHEIVHTGVKKFVCDECSYEFYTDKELARHKKRTHEKRKPHVCEHCGKGFFEKTKYKSHINFHIGTRPHACTNDGCDKAYFEKSHLKSHKERCDRKPVTERSAAKGQIITLLEEIPQDMNYTIIYKDEEFV